MAVRRSTISAMLLCGRDRLQQVALRERGSIYILDDVWDDVPYDVDELSGHGALIGPPIVVCSAFQFEDAVSTLGEAGIVIPVDGHGSTVKALLEDDQALARVAREVQQSRISRLVTFYGGRPHVDQLAEELSRRSKQRLAVWPPSGHYVEYNRKVGARAIWREAGLPAPPFAEVTNHSQATDWVREHGASFLKARHSRSARVADGEAVRGFFSNENLRPVLIEREVANVVSSPILHLYSDGSSVEELFILEQIVDGDGVHRGNTTVGLQDLPLEEILKQGRRAAQCYEGWNGFFAFDFVVDSEGRVFLVDANLRINSSTLPFLWLYSRQSLGSPEAVYLRLPGGTDVLSSLLARDDLAVLWRSSLSDGGSFVLVGGSGDAVQAAIQLLFTSKEDQHGTAS